MTTEREDRDARRFEDKHYPDISELPKSKRLKSLDEMGKGARIKGLSPVKSTPSDRGKRPYLRYAFVGIIILAVIFALSIEVSCRLYGDPIPSQDWRLGYDSTPMIDADDIQNCRINTREHWKDASVDLLKGIGHKFQGLDEPFKEWFESLRDGPQIDDKIVAHTNSLSEWFAELSLNQKIVVGLSTLILLAILWMIFAMLRRLRRWYRRKRIPKNINLHLDRDN